MSDTFGHDQVKCETCRNHFRTFSTRSAICSLWIVKPKKGEPCRKYSPASDETEEHEWTESEE